MSSVPGIHLVHVGCFLLTSTVLAFFVFLVLSSAVDLDAFLNSDQSGLGINGKVWMYSFQNTWNFENPIVGSKVMASKSELKRSE